MAAAKPKPRPPAKGSSRPAKSAKKTGAPKSAKKAAKGAKAPAPKTQEAGKSTTTTRSPSKPRSANARASPTVQSEGQSADGTVAKDDWIVLPEAEAPATLPPVARPASSMPSQAWTPVAPSSPRPDFDPATGAWLPVGPADEPAKVAPDAPKKGTGYVLWTILLWIDLAALAFATLAAILTGATLLFAPESEAADRIRQELEGGSVGDVVLNTIISLVAFGLIPVLWVLGTRQQPLQGAKRFLHLHLHRRQTGNNALAATVLWGFALAFAMLIAVAVLITVYTLATEGADGFSTEEEPNPAVQGLLANLSWPLAFLIAIGAGVGEEIFFRGFLQRYLGVWGQAGLFGLAHATGGYIPQILFAFGLGVAFGFLLKRGWSLWTLMLAHFLYDFVLLGLALLYPELG